MKHLLITSILALAAFTSNANAAAYGHAIENCKTAIGAQMGIEKSDAVMKVKRIKSRAKHRQIKIRISPKQATQEFAQVTANCTVESSSEVAALVFSDNRYPLAKTSVADQTNGGN